MKKMIIVAVLILLQAASAGAALKKNDVAPDFSLQDGAGRVFSLHDVVGPKKKGNAQGVVLSFFASWCIPCRVELPIINGETEDLQAKGIKVILVAFREGYDIIGPLLAELKVDKPLVLSDPDGKAVGKYQVRFLPTTFFIGSDGKLKDVIFGEIRNKRELRERAGKLLRK